MFKKMPFLLLMVALGIAIADPWLAIGIKSFFYSLSLSIKSVIVFFLPFIIFGLLFKTAASLAQRASSMILVIFGAVCLSNFASTMISYFAAIFAYKLDLAIDLTASLGDLQPSFNLALPKLVGNSHAMVAALFLGLILGKWNQPLAVRLSASFEKMVSRAFQGLLWVIPIFILGFIVKMVHDKVMGQILQNYGQIFLLIACALFAYIALLYLIAARWHGLSFIESLKNMMPAAIAGFGSMSSAAAMPLTLLGVEKNSKNKDLARSIVPATLSIHLIGDCFAIPIFAFAVLKSFGVAEPAFASYLVFAGYFLLAKFSIAAVPGGGILVMLPILESVFGFNGAMLSLITALYILFDPVITLANILGNGVFATLVSGKEDIKKFT